MTIDYMLGALVTIGEPTGEAAAGDAAGRLSPTWAARVPDDLRGACP